MTTTSATITPLNNAASADPSYAATASGLNNLGLAVGASGNEGAAWTNKTASSLALLSGDTCGGALGVNDSGLVVGWSSTSVSTGSQAVLWTNGTPTALTPPSMFSGTEATAINNEGVVVGRQNISDFNNTGSYAFLWQNGVFTRLPILTLQAAGGNPIYSSTALAINDNGQIVGWAAENTLPRATLWQNGTVTDLGLWTAMAINNHGIIVGAGNGSANEWQNGTLTTLPNLPSYSFGRANSINDAGIIAGTCTDNGKSTDYESAVIWENGAVIDLNSLLPQNSPWHLQETASINNQNMIVGEGLYNGVEAAFEMTLGSGAIGVTVQTATQSGQLSGQLTIIDSAANVSIALDQLQILAKAGSISSIDLTNSAPATLSISLAQWTNDPDALAAVSGTYKVGIVDSAANIVSELDSLANAVSERKIDAITLTDPGLITLMLTPNNFTDANALAILSGNFVLETASPQSGMSIVNPTEHGLIVTFTGKASDYVISDDSRDSAVEITPVGSTIGIDYVAGATELKFSDLTEIITAAPGSASAPTGGNITELYSAVLAREPDVTGLSFYQNFLKTNPTTGLQTFADYFLNSTEYKSSHSYAAGTAGDTQFIKDSYQNLLHRTPSSDEITFYLTNVMIKPDSHALMLVYFSNSPEFLGDVQITAANPASAQHWLVLV